MVDDPPVPLITFRMPPDPAVLRKIVSRSFRLVRREGDGDLKRVRGVDVYALVEEAVAAHTISSEAGHGVSDLEGCPAVHTRSLHPGRLARRVVGHLVLEEDIRAPVAFPPLVKPLVR